ncbi:hypothetical protein I4F81_008239 [Pyropia yezoensis]|uniref:Uncharacterized protein n=1 Tax=Pyropia yezoensis TaxID=2788 RepID=A0ACC3C7H5_PYRYE|nr:hypothetical protein I4F81_008239 [Neopyropia yezoensis]
MELHGSDRVPMPPCDAVTSLAIDLTVLHALPLARPPPTSSTSTTTIDSSPLSLAATAAAAAVADHHALSVAVSHRSASGRRAPAPACPGVDRHRRSSLRRPPLTPAPTVVEAKRGVGGVGGGPRGDRPRRRCQCRPVGPPRCAVFTSAGGGNGLLAERAASIPKDMMR